MPWPSPYRLPSGRTTDQQVPVSVASTPSKRPLDSKDVSIFGPPPGFDNTRREVTLPAPSAIFSPCIARSSFLTSLRGCWWRCSRSSSFLGGSFRTVSLEYASRSKLSQLVPHHVLGEVDRNKFLAIVNGQRVSHHIWRYRRAARPRLHHFFLEALIHALNHLG